MRNVNLIFAMYDPTQLGYLLQQWGTGNLNNIMDHGHVVVGVVDAVATGSGMAAMGLCQRYTIDDIDLAIARMWKSQQREMALLLMCKYLLDWSTERLARAMDVSISVIQSWLMLAEDAFAERILNAD